VMCRSSPHLGRSGLGGAMRLSSVSE